jgi:hypothetical protein
LCDIFIVGIFTFFSETADESGFGESTAQWARFSFCVTTETEAEHSLAPDHVVAMK